MVKKSFMFGFGVGIIVIGVIFYILYGLDKKSVPVASVQQLTDEEIVQRAQTLGMVFIKDAAASQSPLPTEAATPQASATPTASPETTPAPEATPSEAAPTPSPPEYVSIFIPAGSTSQSISAILAKAGLVDDAKKFDQYIADQGKTGRLMAGWFDIPKDADYQTVLGIILKLSKR